MRSKFEIYPTWPQYIAAVTMRFGEAYEDPLSALIQVKQSGKVQEYVDEFELALTQVSLPSEHSLSIFLAGLEHHTQMHVRMFNPTSIAHASSASLAKLHEASTPSQNKFSNRMNYSGYLVEQRFRIMVLCSRVTSKRWFRGQIHYKGFSWQLQQITFTADYHWYAVI